MALPLCVPYAGTRRAAAVRPGSAAAHTPATLPSPITTFGTIAISAAIPGRLSRPEEP